MTSRSTPPPSRAKARSPRETNWRAPTGSPVRQAPEAGRSDTWARREAAASCCGAQPSSPDPATTTVLLAPASAGADTLGRVRTRTLRCPVAGTTSPHRCGRAPWVSVPGCRTRSPGPLLMSAETLPSRPTPAKRAIPPLEHRGRRVGGQVVHRGGPARRRRPGRRPPGRMPLRPKRPGPPAGARPGRDRWTCGWLRRQARAAGAPRRPRRHRRRAQRRGTAGRPRRGRPGARSPPACTAPTCPSRSAAASTTRVCDATSTFGRRSRSSHGPSPGRQLGPALARRRPAAARSASRSGPDARPSGDAPTSMSPLVTSGGGFVDALADVGDQPVVVLAEARRRPWPSRPTSGRPLRSTSGTPRAAARRPTQSGAASPSPTSRTGTHTWTLRGEGAAVRQHTRSTSRPGRRAQPAPRRRRGTAAVDAGCTIATRAPRPPGRRRRAGRARRCRRRASRPPPNRSRSASCSWPERTVALASWPWNGGLPTTTSKPIAGRVRPRLATEPQRCRPRRRGPARARRRATTARSPPR